MTSIWSKSLRLFRMTDLRVAPNTHRALEITDDLRTVEDLAEEAVVRRKLVRISGDRVTNHIALSLLVPATEPNLIVEPNRAAEPTHKSQLSIAISRESQ